MRTGASRAREQAAADRGRMLNDIAHRRLLNQRVVGERCATPDAAVRWMGAMQAQDYRQSLWAVGLRTRSATAADIERAIADGTIIATWPMRGTIHFVAPEDARWMLRLCASRVIARDGRRLGQLGLDERVLARGAELFHDALSGGRRLPRSAMMALLEDAGVATQNQRGYHILWRLAQTGLVCLGPMQGAERTFGLLDDWAPCARELSSEESLAELAGRYFASHGPATVHDLARWAGITIAEAKAGLAAAKPGLVAIDVDGNEHWMAEAISSQVADDQPDVHLLPGFDEYLIGYKDRSAVLDAEHAPRIVPGANGVFRPMVVAAGRVVGTWTRTVKKGAVDISFDCFTRHEASHAQSMAAAKRYSDFLELPLTPGVLQPRQ